MNTSEGPCYCWRPPLATGRPELCLWDRGLFQETTCRKSGSPKSNSTLIGHDNQPIQGVVGVLAWGVLCRRTDRAAAALRIAVSQPDRQYDLGFGFRSGSPLRSRGDSWRAALGPCGLSDRFRGDGRVILACRSNGIAEIGQIGRRSDDHDKWDRRVQGSQGGAEILRSRCAGDGA